MRLGRHAHPEVDVRLDPGLGARTDRSDDVAFHDRGAHGDRDRPELQQRDRVAVLGANRDCPAVAGHRSSKSDHAGDGRTHIGSDRGADVDSAMLPAVVGILARREPT